MTPELILERVARGAASGMSLLLAVTFIGLRNGSWAARLGCRFGQRMALSICGSGRSALGREGLSQRRASHF